MRPWRAQACVPWSHFGQVRPQHARWRLLLLPRDPQKSLWSDSQETDSEFTVVHSHNVMQGFETVDLISFHVAYTVGIFFRSWMCFRVSHICSKILINGDEVSTPAVSFAHILAPHYHSRQSSRCGCFSPGWNPTQPMHVSFNSDLKYVSQNKLTRC